MRIRTSGWGAALLGVLAAIAGAAGTIVTTGATIEAGAAGNQGTVTIDDAAPEAQAPQIPFAGVPGAIGTMIGAFPPFGDTGDGSDGAFHATAPASLPGGTYNYTTYRIDNGIEVLYDGAVEILVSDFVTIEGDLLTEQPGAAITIRCRGNFRIEGGVVDARVNTSGSDAPIRIEVGADFFGRDSARVNTRTGDIEISAHGVDSGGGTGGDAKAGRLVPPGEIEFFGTRVNTGSGHILVRAKAGVNADDGSLNTSTGDILMQAFGGDVVFEDGSLNISSRSQTLIPEGGIRCEASGSMRLVDSSSVNTSSGNIGLAAYGGALSIDDGRVNTSSGDIDVRASGNITLTQDPRTNTSTGDIRYTSFGGDIDVIPQGQTGGPDFNTSTGDIHVVALRNLNIRSQADFNTSTGDLVLRALTGNMTFDGVPDFNTSTGVFDARAAVGISGSTLDVNTESILISAGDGGIDLTFDQATPFEEGIRVFATGSVAVRGTVASERDVHILSCNGGVDVTGAVITTRNNFGTGSSSGAILIESFAGDAGVIDATNATLRSGDGGISGDVSLLVHAGKIGNQPPPTAIRSFLLPKKIQVKAGAGKKAGPSVKVVGFFDEGPDPVDLTAPAEVTVGPLVFQIPGLAQQGKFLVHEGAQLTLKVRRSKLGSSKGKFNLTFTGDPGNVDLDGVYTLRYRGGGVNAEGTVRLKNGRFQFGKVPGTLIAPALDIRKAKAKLPGVGRHNFKFVAGIAGDGNAPAVAPDVFVGFGDLFNADLPSALLRRKGQNLVLAGRGPDGIAAVALNHAKERITVKGANLDLGAVPEGPTPLLLIVSQDGATDLRAVLVRAVKKGAIFKY